ncbi:MAG TPA: DUF2889 domain-containing protein, partial [Ilumatobacteraceae bacterium]
MTFDRNDIVAPDPEGLEVLHDREYRVRAFRKGDNLLIRGSVRDQKPPGLYIVEDPEPMTVHHMRVDLEVSFPALQIVAVDVEFVRYPNDVCPAIVDHYDKLIGLSISRGFNHKVRELFGGPRGCTHTTALLQAMGPIAVQTFWSMSASEVRQRTLATAAASAAAPADETGAVAVPSPVLTKAERDAQWATNLNSCHVWAEDGDWVAGLRAGLPHPPMRHISARMAELGLDAD